MAVEVHIQQYIFRPPQLPSITIDIPVQNFWRFNPLHDLESIWWIALWSLLHIVPTGINAQQIEANNFFRASPSLDPRRNALLRESDGSDLILLLSKLDVSLPTPVLLFAARYLQGEYWKAEAKLPIKLDALDHSHVQFLDIIQQLMDGLKDDTVYLPLSEVIKPAPDTNKAKNRPAGDAQFPAAKRQTRSATRQADLNAVAGSSRPSKGGGKKRR